MKKIISIGVIMTLLMSSTIASADFKKPSKKETLNNEVVVSGASVCIQDTSGKTEPKCNEGTAIVSGTGILISDEEMKKIEKMTDSEKAKYFNEKFPFPTGVSSGTLEVSGMITVSSAGKIFQGESPLDGTIQSIQTTPLSDFQPLSDEEIKKMEKMSPKEQMEYLDKKYSSKLPDTLGKIESSGVIEASSKDITGTIGKIDEFYQTKVVSLSEENQLKVSQKLKAKLESKLKSTKSKKRAKAYQDMLAHIEANW